MHVRAIQLHNFLTHSDTAIALPERGLVLVTGPNGSGKSGVFVESVASACFGKTLRGTPPWCGDPAFVQVTTNEVEVRRANSGQKLAWNLLGETATQYDTPTKAQLALSGLVGSFDVWRRTNVFSSGDAAHFSLAADRDRKLLLETILGLERFDPALRQCREDLKQAYTVLNGRVARVAVLRERIQGAVERLTDLEETEDAEAAVVAPRMPAEERAAIEATIASIQDELRGIAKLQQGMAREQMSCDADVRQKVRARDQLDHDNCPVCAQAIPKSLRARLHKEAEIAQKKDAETAAAFKVCETKYSADAAALQRRLSALQRSLHDAAMIERDHEQLAAGQARRAEKRALLMHNLRAARVDIKKEEANVLLMQRDVAELQVVDRVLGLKGVRAHMLESAMRAITELANGWLARLFPGVSITLREESDKVELEILGLAHEHGYRACSTGQRRRIDIALLFALSDMEAASRGVSQGTLVFDEVADSLDDAGLASFTDVVSGVAEERCVVVISHNQALHEGLSPVKRFHVSDGRVVEY